MKTAWPKNIISSIRKLNSVKNFLKEAFTHRDTAIDLLALSIVCRENILFLGPPGTAKTKLVTRYSNLLNLQSFHYLLTRYTEPTEIFGPMDIKAYENGSFEVHTRGMLPEAQIVFLDEVFQGSSAILNSLLTILNERIFFNGSVRQALPLISIVGVSNTMPEDSTLRAFADRFLLRLELDPTEDEFLEDLLEKGWELELPHIKQESGQDIPRELPRLKVEEIQALHGCVADINLSAVRPVYARLIRNLRAEGVDLSDRRIVKTMKLIAGATLLRETDAAEVADFWPLFHIWNRFEEENIIHNILEPILAEAGVDLKKQVRSIQEIMIDLDIIVNKGVETLSPTAVGGYLGALSKIRRELINDHPLQKEALQKVEAAIKQGMKKMEVANVQS